MNLEQELKNILDEENGLVFPRFDALIARELGIALEKAALGMGGAITIDIRRGDDIAYFFAMPGTAPENADWARRKRNVVERERRSSYAVGLDCQIKGASLEEQAGLPLRDFASVGGSVPIRVANAGHIGTITVSGLPQRDDHLLVVGVIKEWLSQHAVKETVSR